VSGILAGLRVLDFCWIGAGALVTQTLAMHGAEVIKIESRARPDNLRVAPPVRPGTSGLDASGYFASRNAGKKSFALNLTHPDAIAIAQRLAAASSVVTSNFRPGVMERWSLSYADLGAGRPDLIYLTMPMQGATGPHSRYAGFGSTIAALSGLVAPSGLPGRLPVGTGTHYPDHVPNPGHALVALLAALVHRNRTGRGGRIELSQFESTAGLLGPAMIRYSVTGEQPAPRGNRWRVRNTDCPVEPRMSITSATSGAPGTASSSATTTIRSPVSNTWRGRPLPSWSAAKLPSNGCSEVSAAASHAGLFF